MEFTVVSRRLVAACAAALALVLGGCAAHPDPIIDTKGVDMVKFEQDLAECKTYADNINVGEGAAKGAAVGAAVGAAIGAISGDAGRGAGYGGISGGARSGLDNKRVQERVVKRCLSGRGYRVLN
ncbi:MAG: glycine zipper family protein [Pseudomonadota bacterium]